MTTKTPSTVRFSAMAVAFIATASIFSAIHVGFVRSGEQAFAAQNSVQKDARSASALSFDKQSPAQ